MDEHKPELIIGIGSNKKVTFVAGYFVALCFIQMSDDLLYFSAIQLHVEVLNVTTDPQLLITLWLYLP